MELLKCPFCGGKARLITASADKRRQTNKIECTNKPCVELVRDAMFGVESIIRLWNRRVGEEKEYYSKTFKLSQFIEE